MIDTVILKIPNAQDLIREPEYFRPSLTGIRNPPKYPGLQLFMPYTYNLKSKHKYYPNLTVTPHWDKTTKSVAIPLKIEFSASKLIFLNNVDELVEEDFSQVLSTLQERLSEMGVEISTGTLEDAPVSTIHFSKNVLLSGSYTALFVIKVLEKMAVTSKLKIKHRDYDIDGHATYFDCGQYQIVTYDKIRDALQTKRHSEDKDRTDYQQKLLKAIRSHRPPIEILRLEIRITDKTKLNSLLQKLGYLPNPTFRDVFNEQLSQAMLQYHWKLITPSKSLFLLKVPEPDILLKVTNYIANNGLNLKAIEVNGLVGMIYYSQDHGFKNLEAGIKTAFHPRTWYRLDKYFSLINQIMAERENYSFIDDVNTTLEEFNPLKVNHLLQEVGMSFDYAKESN